MRFVRKTPKKFFWIVLLIMLTVTGGQIYAQSVVQQSDQLVISEFIAENGTGLVDEDGDYSDWIEIYNPSPWPINLAGWALSNDPAQPQQWMFPDLTLGGHEYLVVFASGKNRDTGPVLHTNFKLGKAGEFLGLYNIFENEFKDSIEPQYPPQMRDISYGRYADALSYFGQPSPGRENQASQVWSDSVAPVEFSVARGIYDTPVVVELSTLTPESSIRFTVDGSTPTEEHGTLYTEPIEVGSTTLLRAVAYQPDQLPSDVTTHSYLFLDDVVSQFAAPDTFIPNWGLADAQTNIKTSQKVALTNPRYRSELIASLNALPAVSLVTNDQHFINLQTSPQDLGRESEYPVSLEVIFPGLEGVQGFQIDAGIRPTQGVDTLTKSQKQSFQLAFRGEYGASTLDYPLFDDSSVTVFDSLYLLGNDEADRQIVSVDDLVRDQWLRDTQIAMNNLGAHGRYVHLYLNGLYWGLYNLAERIDDDFMASYLGGEGADWYLADQQGPLSDGDSPATTTLDYLFTSLNFASQLESSLMSTDYLAEVFATTASYFDPEQLADFVILSAYAHQQEWHVTDWTAAIRQNDLPGRGKLLLNERSVQLDETGAPSSGGDAQTSVIEQLFEARLVDPDFKMIFADRLYAHLSDNGALADANSATRWQNLADRVDPALGAEAARWGISTVNDHTDQAAVFRAENAADNLLQMAREAGYYPDIDPPLFSREAGIVAMGGILSMDITTPDCTGCVIYYTRDGTDPRIPITGEVMPGAKAYSGSVALTGNVNLKARVWRPPTAGSETGTWSALNQATFTTLPDDNQLRITEVMYNPVDGDDYEFIELQNVGDVTVNMAGMYLDEGVRFSFPPNTPPLAAGEVVVLASNPAALAEQHPGITIAGGYEGHLSNKGETIELKDVNGKTILAVTYNDEYGWPVSADGRGDSLTLYKIDGDPADPLNWQASNRLGGTPGAVYIP